MFTSAKIEKDLKHREVKPSVVNNQCVVYHFKCDLCDTDYIGYTTWHLHKRIEELKSQASAVGQHIGLHNIRNSQLADCFQVLKRCKSKFDCLIYEMLFIRDKSPKLNTQSDSVRAKVFV